MLREPSARLYRTTKPQSAPSSINHHTSKYPPPLSPSVLDALRRLLPEGRKKEYCMHIPQPESGVAHYCIESGLFIYYRSVD